MTTMTMARSESAAGVRGGILGAILGALGGKAERDDSPAFRLDATEVLEQLAYGRD